MVSIALALTGVTAAGAYLLDAVTPMSVLPGKKIYAIYNWGCIGMAFIATAATVASFMLLNAPMIFLSVSLLGVSLIGSYSVKQLALKQTIEQDADSLQKIESGYQTSISQLKKEIEDLNREKEEWNKREKSFRAEIGNEKQIQNQLDTLSGKFKTYADIAKIAEVDISQFENLTLKRLDQLADLFHTLIQEVATLKSARNSLEQQIALLDEAHQLLLNTLDKEATFQDSVEDDVQAALKAAKGGNNGK